MNPLFADTQKECQMVKMFRRQNGKLYVEYKVNGRVVQKSTGLLDTEENRALVKKDVIPSLEKKIISDDFNNEKPKKFSFYAKRYLSKKTKIKTYTKVCKYIDILNETFGDISIDKIKVSDIEDWTKKREEFNSIKTIKNYLVAMSGVFKEGIKAEVIISNKALAVELDKHIAKVIAPFSNVESEILLKNVKGPMKLFIAIGIFTGLRTGEILALTKADIDLEKKSINVLRTITDGKLQTPKTLESIREVPIFDDLVPYLENITDEGFLFVKRDKSHYSNFPGHYKRAWEKLLKDCSIEYRKIYGTRHTFIVNMIRNSGLSILDIAQTAGHSSIQMIVKHYAKFIKGEHMKIDRSVRLLTDSYADSTA